MGLFGFGKKKEKAAPVQKAEAPKPAPAPETPETLYQKGMSKYDLKVYQLAFPLLQQAAEQGHGKAMLQCAEMYWRGKGVEKDLLLALKLAERAKAQNVPGAGDVHRDILMEFTLEGRGGKKPGVKITSPASAPKAEVPKQSPAPELPKSAPKVEAHQPAQTSVDMKTLLAKAAKKTEENRDKFRAIELNEGNVQAIFNRCGKENEDGSTVWDQEKLVQNKANIRYLLGQLALVHDSVAEHELDGSFFKRYDGKNWTGNGSAVIRLLNMGGKSGFCSFSKKDGKQFVELRTYKLKPALSSKDPTFSMWWETAPALMIQAEIAIDNGDAAKAMELYIKAAEFGNVDAQFRCGQMYEKGIGTEADDSKAIVWYQKAVQQGNREAESRLEYLLTPIKAERGDAEAQYQYAQRLEWNDKKKAFSFYLKAAKQGHAKAQYKTGYCYAFGNGVTKDSQEALKWFQMSAKQGDKYSEFFAELMCKKGLRGNKAIDLETGLSGMIDQYGSLSSDKVSLLIKIYSDLPNSLKDKFNHAQAESMRKLASRV